MNLDLLKRIQADQRRYGERVRPPATPEACDTLVGDVRRIFGAELPPGYLSLLRHSDGLDYAGLVVYDTCSSPDAPSHGFWQGLLAANAGWRERAALRDWLVFAEANLEVFALHLPSGSYRRADAALPERFEVFAGFDDLIDIALLERL